MNKMTLWQAIQMGSEHHDLVEASKRSTAEGRSFVARDFTARAETLSNTLHRHGWRMLNGGLVVERVRKPR